MTASSDAISYQGATGVAVSGGGAAVVGTDALFLVTEIPEPATMSLLVLGGLGLLSRKRRR